MSETSSSRISSSETGSSIKMSENSSGIKMSVINKIQPPPGTLLHVDFTILTEIDKKYFQVIKANPWIGEPITEECICPDGIGHYRHYKGGASIYWTPTTGAHLIYGLIRIKWSILGWEKGPNGYPTTDESDAGSGKGRFNGFQNGVIIWKKGSQEAFSVYGAIHGKWGETNWDSGPLGFPVTDERGTPDGIGRYNHFEGGSIYWTPETGAHFVMGAIRNAWASQGWEKSRLQYPVSDERITDGTGGKGRNSVFEGGEIYWTPDGGIKTNLYPAATTTISCSRDLSAGKVDASQIWVQILSDGNWQFHAYLHDKSTWYGDSYAIGFKLDDGHGAVMTGVLGADYSGPATTADRFASGYDPSFLEFYHKAKMMGANFHLSVSDNPLSAFNTVIAALEKYGPALISLL